MPLMTCGNPGQKPIVTRAKKANAAFKLGNAVASYVRRERMYEFLDRLVNIALPRVRDFRGLNGKLRWAWKLFHGH